MGYIKETDEKYQEILRYIHRELTSKDMVMRMDANLDMITFGFEIPGIKLRLANNLKLLDVPKESTP